MMGFGRVRKRCGWGGEVQKPCCGEAFRALRGPVKVCVTTVLLLAVAFGLLSVFGCSPRVQEPSEEESAVEEPQQPAEPAEPEEEPQAEEEVVVGPPQTAIDKYKGLWLPFLNDAGIALNEVDNLRADGVNIVSLGISIYLDGDVIKDRDRAEIKKMVNEFHRNGIRTCLVLNPGHPEFGIDPFSPEASGRPLFERLTPLALEWAAICEKYGVEMFCPANEPQLMAYQKEQDISDWAQQILPRLREVYTGKLVFLAQYTAEGLPRYNLAGYDYVAIGGVGADSDVDQMPWRTEEKIEETLDSLRTLYPGHRYLYFGVVAFTGPDFYWWEPIAPANMRETNPNLPSDFFLVSLEGQAKFYDVFFSKTWDGVDGYFIGAYKGTEYRDKPAEEVIRNWFHTGD